MGRLEFRVQGSAAEPYRLIAEGEGADLRIFCNCPAGRRGGKFCKHAAQLLVGEVTSVTAGVDKMDELLRRAATSGLTAKAVQHKLDSALDRVPGVSSIDDLLARFAGCIERAGWQVAREGGEGSDSVGLFATYKNGKRHKHPKIQILFEAMTCDHIPLPDGTVREENHRLRSRPWSVRVAGASTSSWGSVDKAALVFLRAAGLSEEKIFE